MVPITVMLSIMLVWTGPAVASIREYPFHVDVVKNGTQQKVIAVNSGPAPVWVSVSIKDAKNITSDRHWPVEQVIPAGQSVTLGSVFPDNPFGEMRFRASSTYSIGDPRATPDPDARYRLPFANGRTFQISQAYGGAITTHTERASQFAVDISMPVGTSIVAAREGIVIDVEVTHEIGGKDASLMDKANTVQILHDDGTMAIYAHLAPSAPFVRAGERVRAGRQLGLSGDTGYSSGPHLHFAVVRNTVVGEGRTVMQSMPFWFYVDSPRETFLPHEGRKVTARYDQGSATGAVEMPRPQRIATPLQGADISLREASSSAAGWMASRPWFYWLAILAQGIFLHWVITAIKKRLGRRL